MKVVHLTSASNGGAFVAAQRLHEQLQLKGVHSEHLVFSGNKGNNYTLWANTPLKKAYAFGLHALEKLDFLRYETSKLLRFRFSHARTGIKIWTHKSIIEADIIHIHWVNKGFISMRGLQKLVQLGKPVFWTTHDLWAFTGGWYHITEEYMAHGASNSKLTNLATKLQTQKKTIWGNGQINFISPSQWLANTAKNLFPKANIEVIKNGVDCNMFTITTNKQYGQTLNLGFVAANLADKNKNCNDFLKIASLLQTKGLKVNCFLVGNTEKLDRLNPEHTYMGEINEASKMVTFYNSIDAVLCTSFMENLPTTLIEAKCCGTAAFGYNIGGVTEIVEPQCMSELGNTNELADKIFDYFTKNKHNRQATREQALADFCIENNVKKTIELYNKSL